MITHGQGSIEHKIENMYKYITITYIHHQYTATGMVIISLVGQTTFCTLPSCAGCI